MKAFVLNGDENSQKLILQASIPFTELMSKAQFAYRVNPSDNPYAINNESDNDRNYQRTINTERVKGIVKYLKNSIIQDMKGNKVAVIFPTAMLLAFNLEDTNFEIGKECILDLPDDEVYIVDGQHRLYSMITLYNEVSSSFLEEDKKIKRYLDSYIYNCTLMMNFDMWEQGQVFADVNFKQKPVNKSLYYDIYGIEYPKDDIDRSKNYIYIAHKLVQFMNDNEVSPFYRSIKMLGTGQGFFSQACLAESVMKHMQTPMGIWYVDISNTKSTPDYRYMAVELISFYTCVKRTFDAFWPKDYKHVPIICKTTGIYALTRLMGYIHNILKDKRKFDFETLKSSKEYVYEPYIKEVSSILEKLLPESADLFGENGKYNGTGGKGLASKLYKKMVEIINGNVL